MSERCLIIPCGSDAMVAILHEPKRAARKVGILFVVGGPQYRVGSHRQFVLMARRFAAAGYPALRFDYRGMGDSSGEQRTFEAVSPDIRAAIDAFLGTSPSIGGVVIFGLCDAASAALIYCASDARVQGLILANPWVRTDVGEAKAYVRHYYGKRLLQRSFWAKVLGGKFDVLLSLSGLMGTLRRSIGRVVAVSLAEKQSFLADMANGFDSFRGPVLLVMSGRDLTARQFDDLCGAVSEWSIYVSSPRVHRVDLPTADHTFSTAAALAEVSEAMLCWLREKCDPVHDLSNESRRPDR